MALGWKTPLACALAVGVAGLAAAVDRAADAPVASTVAPPAEDPVPVHTVDATRIAVVDRAVPRPTPPSPAPAEDPPAPEEVLAQERAQALALEARLESEPSDGEWRGLLHGRAREQLGALPGVRLGSLACGTTVCRLEVGVADGLARDAVLERVSALLDPGAEGYAYLEAENDQDFEVYLGRAALLATE